MTSPLNSNLPPNLPPIGPRRVVYLEANRAPTPLDTKYRDGSYYEFNTEWRDKSTTPPNIYKLANILSKTNAVWVLVSGGSGTIINIDVDTSTPPGTDPVQPSGSGSLRLTGAQVASGIVGTNLIRTASLAANEITIQIQQSGSAASKDVTINGACHFNSTQFTVDEGFVSLTGGGAAIDSITVDADTPPGVNPVVPTGSGQIAIVGQQVAAGTVGANAIRSFSPAPSNVTIQIQRAAAASSSSVNNAGILSADSSQFSIDANGWMQLKSGANIYGVGNLSIGYSAGIFTVAGYDGSALSATNPGIVWLQDKTTPGRLRRYLVTANQSFTDGSAGQIDNMRWGLTTGVNWANDAPFYLYAITNDALDTIAFAISRIPHLTTSPAAAKLGKQGAVVNVSQSDMYLLPNITVADYEQNPCMCIGSFRMQFAGATDSWTVQTLDVTDGIGQFHDETLFNFPTGQFGAATGTYFLLQGGATSPIFSSQSYMYQVSRTGVCRQGIRLATCTTPGTSPGGQTLTGISPFVFTGANPFGQFMGAYSDSSGPLGNIIMGATSGSNQYVVSMTGVAANLLQSAIDTNDNFQGQYIAPIST